MTYDIDIPSAVKSLPVRAFDPGMLNPAGSGLSGFVSKPHSFELLEELIPAVKLIREKSVRSIEVQ
jgi:hypothetical protein